MKYENVKSVDLIIVGGGLAGCCLAWNAIFNNLSVVIIDNGDKNISSNVTAGLFNPITGRTFQKSWKADILFPFLETFYKQVEKTTKSIFFSQSNILKPFWNKQEYDLWSKSNMLDDNFINIIHPNNDMTFGGIKIKKSGFLDVRKFLNITREFLNKDNTKKLFFVKEDFDYKNLTINRNSLKYKTVICNKNKDIFIAKNIIFCEGIYGCFNPFFTDLPFRPVLGEILDIEVQEDFKYIYNRDVFILSKKNKIATIGSTYKRLEYNDTNSTFSYKKYKFSKHTFKKDLKNIIPELNQTLCNMEEKDIINKANKLLKACGKDFLPQSNVDRKVGIRPCTLNRRPILEIHPKYPNMAMFNGLGTKGVSLAPYFSEKILNNLFN